MIKKTTKTQQRRPLDSTCLATYNQIQHQKQNPPKFSKNPLIFIHFPWEGEVVWDIRLYRMCHTALSPGSYNRITAYQQSKLANVMHATELARRVEDFGIRTYSLHPGKSELL